MFEKQKDIKDLAKELLLGTYSLNLGAWATVFGITLVSIPLMYVPVLGLIPPLLLLLFMLGLTKISFTLYSGNIPSIKQLFSIFRKFPRSLGGQLWRCLFLGFWAFLFFIPANCVFIYTLYQDGEIIAEIPWDSLSPMIIPEYYDYFIALSGGFTLYLILFLLGLAGLILKSFTYSMVPFLLVNTETVPVTKMLSISKRMIRNNLKDTILFFLSFTGWWLLSVITCGIFGVFWFGPYFYMSLSGLYLLLKDKAIKAGVCSEEEFI